MKMDITVDWTNVQKRLAQLGFDPGPIDGLKGPRTEAAIVAFKRSIGLRPRPYLGPLTRRALFGDKIGQQKALVPWMAEAIAVKGIHEVRDLPRLARWIDASFGRHDWRSIAWCGAFVGNSFLQWDESIDLPGNPLGARNWLKFGAECGPQYGAVMVFWRGSPRGWKGHVGFYWGEDRTHYHILGGNQSNTVNVARISKKRFLGARWHPAIKQTKRRVLLNANGVPVTTNEA
ncbi:TIGR02594 family protein [Sulfitobacter sp. M57]|nr:MULTISPECIES: peptidoglycan-binding protein [unclassified Sulfitobacter]MDF3431845.1 TIGR02594 family protein [Sulfitobacter sp. KE42]MDF3461387.1 TIGR02594 family protein [Sulfitobacter sp. Ks18]MDF3511942.1 TIGR02594 family protein [Sulfitobacter sp. M36]MDF3519732.1 TIGR02594 family protein [Sulfitobacter sp. M74]MDF3539258.1 TIGR02594 family protein [Sulfitobacter sp. M62]